MAAFYLDENVALAIEDQLRIRRHAVTSTFAERRLGAPDPHQLLFAAGQRRVFVTHNRRDFRLLHDAWLLWSRAWRVNRPRAGILILDQIPEQRAADVARIVALAILGPGRRFSNRGAGS